MESSKKLPRPLFIVLKKMIHGGVKYYPPRMVKGSLEFDTVRMHQVEAKIWNHAGCIAEERKIRKGMLVHPDDTRHT